MTYGYIKWIIYLVYKFLSCPRNFCFPFVKECKDPKRINRENCIVQQKRQFLPKTF